MPNQLTFPDPTRTQVHNTVNQVVQSMQQQNAASKKRKRSTPDQNGGDYTMSSKRGSMSNINGSTDHGNDLNVDAFTNNLNSSKPSNDFDALAQLRHAATSTHDPSSTAAAALAAHMGGGPSEISFVSNGSGSEGDRQMDSAFDLGGDGSQNHMNHGGPYNVHSFTTAGGTAAQVQAAREASIGGSKPPVGSDEWHKVRRDNHKEVERRRRETINEGINELAKIVPGCEKNKGSILQRAVTYIMQLKANKDKQVEHHTLEKVVMEQAIAELSQRNEEFKSEVERVWKTNEQLISKLRELGVERVDGVGELKGGMNGMSMHQENGGGGDESEGGGSD
ncbi:MAG: basic helix-loop-helix protein [Icmadophila ericetorum]|nr:basic helix-loop-helix protein [Icmadophila ericetorum]